MSYTPPAGNAAASSWAGAAAYTPPAGDAAVASWLVHDVVSLAWPVIVEEVTVVALAWPLAVDAAPEARASVAWPVAIATPAVASLAWPLEVLDASVVAGLDGAGGWAAAPDGRWRAVCILDGADVSSRLVGAVRVTHEDSTARLAEFAFRPAATLQPMSLIGRPVRIAFAQADGLNAQTLFSGVVDVPQVDLQTGVVTCTCHDQAQEVWAAMPREAIAALVGGRWHVAVSGEPEDGYAYLTERIQSVGASWALDALQQPRILPWRDLSRSVTVRQADLTDGTLSVELPSRAALRTRVTCRMQYRYQALRARHVLAQYSHNLALIRPRGLYPGVAAMTAAMVMQACEGVRGWTLAGEVQIEHPQAGAYMIGTSVNDGFYIISPRVAQDLALGFRADYTARWQQSVTEDYSITVVWPQMEAQLDGPVGEEIGVSLEADFDAPGWGSDETVEPLLDVPGVGDAVLPYQPVGFDAETRDEVLRTLLDRAWVRLWSASRSGRTRFELPCRPDLWLDVWCTVAASRINASGKIVDVEHVLDTGSGRAVTVIGVASGMPGDAAAAHPAWTLPAAPTDSYTPPVAAFSFQIGEYIGGSATSPPFDDETMIGFATNLNGVAEEGINYYPHQLSIKAPDLAAEDRDPRELSVVHTIAVDVPTDLLEML